MSVGRTVGEGGSETQVSPFFRQKRCPREDAWIGFTAQGPIEGKALFGAILFRITSHFLWFYQTRARVPVRLTRVGSASVRPRGGGEATCASGPVGALRIGHGKAGRSGEAQPDLQGELTYSKSEFIFNWTRSSWLGRSGPCWIRTQGGAGRKAWGIKHAFGPCRSVSLPFIGSMNT